VRIREFQRLLVQSKKINSPAKGKNIFSIGGRGHYENPISDILSFFCDNTGQHNLGDLFLKAIFECIDACDKHNLTVSEKPRREEFTEKGNKIDLLIEGDDWVLLLENKIWHPPTNPFSDYENYAVRKYPGKKIIPVILAHIILILQIGNLFHIKN